MHLRYGLFFFKVVLFDSSINSHDINFFFFHCPVILPNMIIRMHYRVEQKNRATKWPALNDLNFNFVFYFIGFTFSGIIIIVLEQQWYQ